jgi:deoxycytidylate deaminase
MIRCRNCKRSIGQYHIKAIWYHQDTGQEQCDHEDLIVIEIAEPDCPLLELVGR